SAASLEGCTATGRAVHPSRLAQRRKCAAELAPQDDGDKFEWIMRERLLYSALDHDVGCFILQM
ncbi:hypothetical protein, partial [Bradyrhizobium altum]|uniref:hypothetical protein n=1 Tax=Bradyrhizobium altum TaxID=1571202 RepID=UPI001E636A44